MIMFPILFLLLVKLELLFNVLRLPWFAVEFTFLLRTIVVIHQSEYYDYGNLP